MTEEKLNNSKKLENKTREGGKQRRTTTRPYQKRATTRRESTHKNIIEEKCDKDMSGF